MLAPPKRIDRQVKGVSVGGTALPGLFDKCTGPTVLHLALEGCGAPRPEDVSRIAAELALGVYCHGAVPWLSLESTDDRRAKRLSTLHPCYRGTLVGRVCLELDVALKSVGGTAHGGLFLDCAERDSVLESWKQRDWGPNGQREWPEDIKGPEGARLANIQKKYRYGVELPRQASR